jgi:acetolactate synthase regulatory subunit
LATLPQMEKMLDVYHVEICCEDQDWESLDTFTKASTVVVKTSIGC